MLQRGKGNTKTYAFLLAIDCQDFVDLEKVRFHLSDAISWMEGCGKTEAECLGPIDVYEELPIEL